MLALPIWIELLLQGPCHPAIIEAHADLVWGDKEFDSLQARRLSEVVKPASLSFRAVAATTSWAPC
jgi:hypothetical protein